MIFDEFNTQVISSEFKLDELVKVVTPAKAGVQKNSNYFKILDSGFRRNDVAWVSATFDELVKLRR